MVQRGTEGLTEREAKHKKNETATTSHTRTSQVGHREHADRRVGQRGERD